MNSGQMEFTTNGKKIFPHIHQYIQQFNESHGKIITSRFTVTAIHQFADVSCTAGTEAEHGYDWYIVEQKPDLNGAPGYSRYNPGTNVKIDNKEYYVGQGKCVRYFVKKYAMRSYIASAGNNDKMVSLEKKMPDAINNVKTYTQSFGWNISGSLGFEGGAAGGAITALCSGSLVGGVSASESVSFQVADCTCASYTAENNNPSSVRWEYTFRDAEGSWKNIDDAPMLSRSTFSPENIWVWRVPTKEREKYLEMKSEISVHVRSMHTRNSGSLMNPKIRDSNVETFTHTIKLPKAKLLCCESEFITFDGKGGTRRLALLSEYTSLTTDIEYQDKNETGWLDVKILRTHTRNIVLEISADILPDTTDKLDNRTCLITITGKTLSEKTQSNAEEFIKIRVSQLEKPAVIIE